MLRIEKKMLNFLTRHFLSIAFFVALFGTIVLRYLLRGYISMDMSEFLIPWVRALREGGFTELLTKSNYNYNMLYAFLLWPFTFLPISEVVVIKLVSFLFDYLAAGAMALCATEFFHKNDFNKKRLFFVVFIGSLLLPIPLINSAIWGQCDIVYTFFLLLSIFFLSKNRYTLAFLMFALAFCCKLQAIFFLPVLVILYFQKKSFSILQFLQVPVIVFLFGLFGYARDQNIFYGFTAYFSQLNASGMLYMNYPNIFSFSHDRVGVYDFFSAPAIVFTFLILFCMLVYIISSHIDIKGDQLILLTVWSVLTCVMFLPSMHERYGFAAELIIWLFFFAKPKVWRFILAIAINLAPLFEYVRYFFDKFYLSYMGMSLLNVGTYIALSVITVLYFKKAKSQSQNISTLGFTC